MRRVGAQLALHERTRSRAMAFLACTSEQAADGIGDTYHAPVLDNLSFTAMPDGSSSAKAPPAGIASFPHAARKGEHAGAHARAFVPPQNGKLLRAQLLLLKQQDYPYAWRQNKACLYDDGSLVFIDHAPEKAHAQDADLSGRSTPVKGVETRRLQLSKRSVVLSPSNETFKIGERGGNQDFFCTCQGSSAADREEWVDVLMRTIMSLQEEVAASHRHSSQTTDMVSLSNTAASHSNSGVGGMFSQRQGWEAGEPIQPLDVRWIAHAPRLLGKGSADTDTTPFAQITRRTTRARSRNLLPHMGMDTIALLRATTNCRLLLLQTQILLHSALCSPKVRCRQLAARILPQYTASMPRRWPLYVAKTSRRLAHLLAETERSIARGSIWTGKRRPRDSKGCMQVSARLACGSPTATSTEMIGWVVQKCWPRVSGFTCPRAPERAEVDRCAVRAKIRTL